MSISDTPGVVIGAFSVRWLTEGPCALQVAPSAEVATAKNLASCREFLVEDTYPAPPRPALSCISSASSMASVASAIPATSLHGKQEPSRASPPERSLALGAQHTEQHTEGPASRALGDLPTGSMPISSFGQHAHNQHGPNSKGDASKAPEAGSASSPGGSAAAQQALAAVKALPTAGQPGQQHGITQTNSFKNETGKGAMTVRTLMYFKGCPRALGCTVLLKGAPRNVLAPVKKVMEVSALSHRAVQPFSARLHIAIMRDGFQYCCEHCDMEDLWLKALQWLKA